MMTMLLVCLSGCGNANKNAVQYTYEAEFQTLNESNYIDEIEINSNNMYYSVYSKNKDNESGQTTIYKTSIDNDMSDAVPIIDMKDCMILGMTFDNANNLLCIVDSFALISENGNLSESIRELRKYSLEGEALMAVDISTINISSDYSCFHDLVVDGEGNIYVADENAEVYVMDGAGNLLFSVSGFSYIENMTVSRDGIVYVSGVDTKSAIIKSIKSIDAVEKRYAKTYADMPVPQINSGLTTGVDCDILINASNTIYSFDADTGKSQGILDWIDNDINSSSIDYVGILQDGRIIVISSNYNDDKVTTEIVCLTKKEVTEENKRIILTLGAMYMNGELKDEIIHFNKTSETYRIQVINYSDYNFEDAMNRMNIEITTGNSLDIIKLDNMYEKTYCEAGILEDINSFIDDDLEINREDYIPNILSAFETNGKLYGLTPNFSIKTLIGKKSEIGDQNSWTINEMRACIESKASGTLAFEYESKDAALLYSCLANMDRFINWETGECNFDTDEFQYILEFANTIDGEDMELNDMDEEIIPAMIQSGELLLMQTDIMNVRTYQLYQAICKDDMNCIGFPVESGSGSLIQAGVFKLGMLSTSEHKEGVWEFLRSFLTEDYQMNISGYYFPIMNKALDTVFEEAMASQNSAEQSGNREETPKVSFENARWHIEPHAATQAEIDAVRKLILSAHSTYYIDIDIYNIISEESKTYFSGEKTVEEAVKIIQNRLSTYVKEKL